KIELENTVFAPAQLMRETQALFAGSARDKGLELRAYWRAAPAQRYRSDAHRLRQMLSNLVGNAIKFTAQGGVRIEGGEVERADDAALLEFSVSDTGIGIPAEKIDLLFKPFSQADSSTTREFGGTGLGLSIVNSLAKLIGGDVGVDSVPGQGSRFWFRVRVEVVGAGVDSTVVVANRAEEAMVRPLRRGHVLVAEDNAINRLVIKAMLGKLGFQVSLKENGQEAVGAIVNDERFDLVLMDLSMPVLDGCGATEQIRRWEAENNRPRLPIIAFTAGAFDEDRVRSLAAGMDDFLTKPVNRDALQGLLDKWLRPPPA
ncbi:MAG TPA: ATP-binding protein, partial [Accumulibacter sp.]|nr:ATP-binding protein [Accumulibacter sp.]